MAIRFTCKCGQELQAREEHAGRITRCPACGAEMKVPAPSTEVQAAPRRDAPEPVRHPERDEDDWQDSEDSGRRVATGTSRKAVWSLLLGIFSVGCTLFTGIPAVILGILGLLDINRSQGRLGGNGMAIAGIVTGIIGPLLSIPIFVILIGLLLPAVQKVREAASRATSTNNLKQIGLAMHNYNNVTGTLPPAALKDKAGKPGLSWRVALLPYLEQESLYREFHLDEPWDSEHNKKLIPRMPKTYAHPSADPAKTAAGFTHYRAFVGPGTAFDPALPKGAHIPIDFPDGTTNTILVVEAGAPVEWTKPDDLPFGPGIPLPKLGLSNSGVQVLLADAGTRVLEKGISDATLRAAITRNGGEVLGPDW